MEQVEYSNVVILNKQDLINDQQKTDIFERINLLNPRAKVLTSHQSKIDVKEILNTNLYDKKEMDDDAVMCSATRLVFVSASESLGRSVGTYTPNACSFFCKHFPFFSFVEFFKHGLK